MIREGPSRPGGRRYLQETSAASLIDQLPIPLTTILDSGEIVHASPAFDEMLGREAGYATGTFIQSLLASGTSTELAQATSTIDFMRTSFGRVVGFRYRDGSVVHAIVGLHVLLDSSDRLLLVAFHDVTEQLWSQTITTSLGSLSLQERDGCGTPMSYREPPR